MYFFVCSLKKYHLQSSRYFIWTFFFNHCIVTVEINLLFNLKFKTWWWRIKKWILPYVNIVLLFILSSPEPKADKHCLVYCLCWCWHKLFTFYTDSTKLSTCIDYPGLNWKFIKKKILQFSPRAEIKTHCQLLKNIF